MTKKEGGSGQSIEQLQKRYQELNRKKIQAETNLENARENLANLKEQARREFGTDDLQELQKKLAEMKTENERRRSEYEQNLDRIEQALSSVEKDFSQVQSAGDRDEA